MKGWQNRVISEKRELDTKISKLTLSLSVLEIPYAERDRLQEQRTHMERYSKVLKDRINNFEEVESPHV